MRSPATAAVRATAGLLLVALLPACTPGADAGPAAGAAPEVVEDGPAATDGPRPQATDVVLARAAFDEESGSVRGSGYVSPVVETGGTCTLELTRDGRTVSVSGPAEPDASTTVCGGLAVPGDQVGPGRWEAVLRYRSANTSGESAPLDVEVPS